MTNRNALSKHFYNSDPLALQRSIARRFLGWDPYQVFAYTDNVRNMDSEYAVAAQDTASQYTERTKDGDEFTIYTKGDYPKLRIMKDLDEEGQLKGLNIFAAIPGVLEDEVSVNVLGQEVTIEVSPKGKLEENAIILNELPNRNSRVVIGISGPFKMDSTEAKFEKSGMLNIYIPAVDKPKSKKIQIGKDK